MKKALKGMKFKDVIKALRKKKRGKIKNAPKKRKRPIKTKKAVKKRKIKRIVRHRIKHRTKHRIKHKIKRKIKHKTRRKKRRKISRKSKILRSKTHNFKDPLDQLFESSIKIKLLKLFFRNPEELFSIKDVFRRIKGDKGVARREFKKLEKLGIIRKKKGAICHANTHFEFFNELKNLILKPAVISKNELMEKVKRLGSVKLLVLSGIFTENESSKADLLVVGDKINQKKMSNFIKDLEIEAGKELKCVAMTTNEFIYRYDMYDRFVRDLIENKSEILIKKLNLW